jgi:acetolactate synthase I/II/III large subunit
VNLLTILFKELTDTDMLLDSLASQGVTSVFGCHGNHTIPTDDDSTIKYIQLKHEQAAVHAADGYARATGKPGVVFLNTASGVTNGVTGIATAYSDSVPLVIVVCPFSPMEKENAQEINVTGLAVPITKHILMVSDVKELSTVLPQAFTYAAGGRPGPVLVVLSKTTTSYTHTNFESVGRSPVFTSNTENISKPLALAVQMMEDAKRPVFFIGGGTIISGAAEQLREVLAETGIPVVSSLMGLGAFHETEPQFLGMLGMHGTFAANKAVHHCDLLISVGVRFSDRVTGKISGFSPKSKKIHVDIDPAEINKIIQVDVPIVCDATEFFKGLRDQLNGQLVRENCKEWIHETTNWKRTVPRFDTSKSLLRPQDVIKMLDEGSDEDAIVVTDVGQHQIWTAHNYTFTKPRSLITSGGLGTMGFGFPAAIGAAVSSPSTHVICVSGDGSFQMNLQELITAVTYKLPIKIAIMNNGYLGMVRQWQEMFYERRYSSVKMTSPDFVKLAQAYGVVGLKASTEAEARQVIKEAFEIDGPVLMEFNVMEEENLYPIVPPNHDNVQIIMSRGE